MANEYRTIIQKGVAEIIIEKSRFIGYSAPISGEGEAIDFINEIKGKHPDATHNVSAYVAGMANEVQRYNDDGEPSGTAGVPILEVLKKEDLRNMAVVVTRYFGGIKLGAGGLIRAYTKGAKIAVDAGQIITKKLHRVVEVAIDYTLLGKVQNNILGEGYLIKEIKYDNLVHLAIYVPITREEIFHQQVIEWTNARCELTKKSQEFLTIK